MKIWTIERFVEGLPEVSVVYSEEAAHRALDANYQPLWEDWFPEEPFPGWEEAHCHLSGQSVPDGSLMWFTQHEIEVPPCPATD